jgi:excisionase family DNA binding protein
MTAAEAAKHLGISRSMLYQLCGQRLIRHRRFGTKRGVLSFDQADLDEYKARTEVPPKDPKGAELPVKKHRIPDYVPRPRRL